MHALVCPLCRNEVPARSASCTSCHLPIADVRGGQRSERTRRGASWQTRLWGLAIYAGIVAWCLLQLPSAAAFVVPGAVVGVVLHAVRGRPLTGAAAFIVIVAVAPALLWPSMATEIMDSFGSLL